MLLISNGEIIIALQKSNANYIIPIYLVTFFEFNFEDVNI